MSKRREGRETAVQLLFSHEFSGEEDAAPVAERFFTIHNAKGGVRAHAEELYRGVLANLEAIDARLVPTLENFSMERLGNVDRSIIRVALYEMFHTTGVPPIVAINEAIEIAKRFGGPDSGRFVNGILDRLKTGLARPLRGDRPAKS